MSAILPVEPCRTISPIPSSRDVARNTSSSIRKLLFRYGLSKTLEYFCTFSVFSVK